jgi:hypothetical protein
VLAGGAARRPARRPRSRAGAVRQRRALLGDLLGAGDRRPLLEEALERFPLVVELTERALPNHTTDLGLMQNSPSREIAEVVHAVNAEAERTGALILAEGSRPRRTCGGHWRSALPTARAGCSGSPAG